MTRFTLFLIFLFAIQLGVASSSDTETIERSLEISSDSPFFAEINEVKITDADLDGALASIPVQDRAGYLGQMTRVSSLVRRVVIAHLLATRAIENGAMSDSNLNAELYAGVIDMLARYERDRYLESVELPDYTALAREAYLTDTSKFFGPETVDFYHVLVTVGDHRSESEAMKRIAEAYDLLQSGALRSDIATEYSDDSASSGSGGVYEAVAYESLEGAVARPLSTLAIGELSNPIRTPYGWHLVVPLKREKGEKLAWASVREEAIEAARDRHLSQSLELLFRDIQDAPITFAPGAIASLKERHGAAAITIESAEPQ